MFKGEADEETYLVVLLCDGSVLQCRLFVAG